MPESKNFHWINLSQIEKIAWLWNETNHFIEEFKSTNKNNPVLTLKAEEIFNNYKSIESIFTFIGISEINPAVKKMIKKPVNKQKKKEISSIENLLSFDKPLVLVDPGDVISELDEWYEAPVAALSFSDNCALVRVWPGRSEGAGTHVEVLRRNHGQVGTRQHDRVLLGEVDIVFIEVEGAASEQRLDGLERVGVGLQVDELDPLEALQVAGQVLRDAVDRISGD